LGELYSGVIGISIVSSHIVESILEGSKVLVFGVGGNASTAMHFSAELSGKYEKFEKPLPCVCLSENTSTITAITNDFGWDNVFSRQIEALAKPGDTVLAFSISGKGRYLENAYRKAKELNCKTILVNGEVINPIPTYLDVLLVNYSSNTPRVQEWQLLVVHQLCEKIKGKFENETK
jgi:D-sedoheptulose 7-phosphate isomerase